MIALGRSAGALEIQLCREPIVYLHAVQREIALVGVRFREAGGSPPGKIEALGVRQVILAGTAGHTVRVKRCCAVANLAHLAGTSRRNIPGVPGGCEHMLSA